MTPASRTTGDRMPEAPPSACMPEEVLVLRARERDSEAREELFERYRIDAYRVAYRLLGHEQDALDVVQESLTKALSGLGEFDGRSGFRYWFLRIVLSTKSLPNLVLLVLRCLCTTRLPGARRLFQPRFHAW